MATISPFAHPMYIMLKPAGSLCNLRCKYCYYLEKNKLYQEQKNHVISSELLEKFVKDYIAAQTTPQVLFTWHGGETLIRPIAFYRRALELQRIYGRGRQIDNCIQTNGTLITDELVSFSRPTISWWGSPSTGRRSFTTNTAGRPPGAPPFAR
jgi:uncharacterized protein